MTAAAATFDPRTTLARPDLAEQALEGCVRAEAYRASTGLQGAVAMTPIRSGPGHDQPQIDQLIFGEAFDVLETRAGWAWGRSRRSGAVGWIAAEGLNSRMTVPTHRIAVASAEVFEAPAGGHGVMTLPLNALVAEADRRDGRVQIAGAGWVAADHLADLATFDADPATAAERLIGASFQMGGRTASGINCSGLVQQALQACGLGSARFRAGQVELGRAVAADQARRGDLVFWDDHSGVMTGPDSVVHVVRRRGAVVVETLAEADGGERAEGSGAPIFRRVIL